MMGGGLMMDQGMVFPGVHNFVDLLQQNGDKNLGFGSLMPQTSSGDQCVMGEGDLVDPPPESFPDAGEDDSDDDVEDIEELERRMWRDRMKLKRLRELQQTRGKDQAAAGGGGGDGSSKPRQSQEQARRKKMSRAQDGILKYMLKMMEVCRAQGFVYGIIPEKGKPVSGASAPIPARSHAAPTSASGVPQITQAQAARSRSPPRPRRRRRSSHSEVPVAVMPHSAKPKPI